MARSGSMPESARNASRLAPARSTQLRMREPSRSTPALKATSARSTVAIAEQRCTRRLRSTVVSPSALTGSDKVCGGPDFAENRSRHDRVRLADDNSHEVPLA
jgi:hypothetical protein